VVHWFHHRTNTAALAPNMTRIVIPTRIRDKPRARRILPQFAVAGSDENSAQAKRASRPRGKPAYNLSRSSITFFIPLTTSVNRS
jgi:hypothetical protein